MSSPFQKIAALHPGRSRFNMSHSHVTSLNVGKLVPIFLEDCIPGDKWRINQSALLRFMPMVTPVLHEFNVFTHYFFVPYRLLWESWEKFITKGKDGDLVLELPRYSIMATNAGSLWDYFGFAIGPESPTVTDYNPVLFPWQAYFLIYNEWYRDQDLQPTTGAYLKSDGVWLDRIGGDPTSEPHKDPLNRNWEKDYFTSARPFQQRGPAPAFPISGGLFVEFDGQTVSGFDSFTPISATSAGMPAQPFLTASRDGETDTQDYFKSWLAQNHIDLDTDDVATFDVSDLRTTVQLQRWMERNARAGVRYAEFLPAHFGVRSKDSRLDRPEFIGGVRQPCVISEVLQTSKTDNTAGEESPQGNMAGHGISASRSHVASYYVPEHGLIMGIMSVMPRSMYTQGIPRQWLRRFTEDYYFPEFQDLSEQGIYKGEIYFDFNNLDQTFDLWGYQGRYDEYRVSHSIATGLLRTTSFDWTAARKFTQLPELGDQFLQCQSQEVDHIFALASEGDDVSQLIAHIQFDVSAIRPMSIQSNPGRVDHN